MVWSIQILKTLSHKNFLLSRFVKVYAVNFLPKYFPINLFCFNFLFLNILLSSTSWNLHSIFAFLKDLGGPFFHKKQQNSQVHLKNAIYTLLKFSLHVTTRHKHVRNTSHNNIAGNL